MALFTVENCRDQRHPFFDIRRHFADKHRVHLAGGLTCTRIAHFSAALDAPAAPAGGSDGEILYSLSDGARVHVRGLRSGGCAVDLATFLERHASPSAPPRFVVPWDTACCPDTASRPVSSATNAAIIGAMALFAELLSPEPSTTGQAVGARLLAQCGALAPFVLEVFMAALLLIPHDHKNNADAALQYGTFAYTSAVDGLVSAQVGADEARAIDAAQRLGMAALPVHGIPTAPWSRRSARLLGPRFLRLGDTLHTLHATGMSCHCAAELPLHCRLVGCGASGARYALASLLRVLEFEGVAHAKTFNGAALNSTTVRWGVYECDEADGAVLVVWSLVYGGVRGGEEQAALLDVWHSQLLYDTLHLLAVQPAAPAVDPALIERWRAQPALSSCATAADLVQLPPCAGCAVDTSHVPRGRMCVLVCNGAGEVVSDCCALGKHAAALAGARVALERRRSARGAQAYFQSVGAQQLCGLAKTLVYAELRQSVERIRRRESGGAAGQPGRRYGDDPLWRSPEYNRLQSRICESRDALVSFFSSLNDAGEKFTAHGSEARIGGGLKLALDGKYALHWQEFRAGHNPQSGAGLGSLVWYCKQYASADEALQYIRHWCAGTLKKGLPPPPQQGDAVHKARPSTATTAQLVPEMLRRCGPLNMRLRAWAYLCNARGLADLTPALVAHNDSVLGATGLQYMDNNGAKHLGSALVVVSEDRRCLQRVFVDDNGNKRQIPLPKQSFGPVVDETGRFCGARVTPMPAEYSSGLLALLPLAVLKRVEAMCMSRPRTCFLSEGPETALSVAAAAIFLAGRTRVPALSYCTFGCNNLPHFKPPPFIERVVLCRENEASDRTTLGVGNYAERCRAVLERERLQVISVWPVAEFGDFNDMLKAVPGTPGAKQICAHLETMIESHVAAAAEALARKRHLAVATCASHTKRKP
jgi:hypothetical protein